MSGGRLMLAAWLCVGMSACQSGTPAPAVPEAIEIVRADGSPLPAAFAYGMAVDVKAVHSTSKEPAANVTWTGVGPCGLDGSPGAMQSLAPVGLGTCTLTASADGATASVMIAFVASNGISVLGDTKAAFVVGETRMYAVDVDIAGSSPGAVEVGIEWTLPLGRVFDTQVMGRTLKVTAVGVGVDSFGVVAGTSRFGAQITSVPAAVKIDTANLHVRAGSDVIINVQALAMDGSRCAFENTEGIQLFGAEDLALHGSVAGPVAGRDGSVFFLLQGMATDCPALWVVADSVFSNTLSVTVEPIMSVVIQGPADPVVVGSTVRLRAIPLDAVGQPFSGHLTTLWEDSAHIYSIRNQGALETTATIKIPGTTSIVAIVNGVMSAPFVSSAIDAP